MKLNSLRTNKLKYKWQFNNNLFVQWEWSHVLYWVVAFAAVSVFVSFISNLLWISICLQQGLQDVVKSESGAGWPRMMLCLRAFLFEVHQYSFLTWYLNSESAFVKNTEGELIVFTIDISFEEENCMNTFAPALSVIVTSVEFIIIILVLQAKTGLIHWNHF